jgi:hypothetical protein
VVGDVREDRVLAHVADHTPLRRDGQQPGSSRPVAVGDADGALLVLVLEAGGGSGLLGAPGLPPQGTLAGDIGQVLKARALRSWRSASSARCGCSRCW